MLVARAPRSRIRIAALATIRSRAPGRRFARAAPRVRVPVAAIGYGVCHRLLARRGRGFGEGPGLAAGGRCSEGVWKLVAAEGSGRRCEVGPYSVENRLSKGRVRPVEGLIGRRDTRCGVQAGSNPRHPRDPGTSRVFVPLRATYARDIPLRGDLTRVSAACPATPRSSRRRHPQRHPISPPSLQISGLNPGRRPSDGHAPRTLVAAARTATGPRLTIPAPRTATRRDPPRPAPPPLNHPGRPCGRPGVSRSSGLA